MPDSRTDVDARRTLGQVLGRLGSTLISLEAGHLDPTVEVSSVVIYDPLDPPPVTAGALVLGVGLSGADEIAGQVRTLAAEGCVGLLVREPVPMHREIASAVESTGIVVLSLVRGASWIQVATMLSSSIGDESRDESGTPDTAAELFDLANTVAGMIDAPVTIEDLSSRVVAFSANQDDVDEARRQSILGLRVPSTIGDQNRQQGLFRQVYSADHPLFFEQGPGALPRTVMRIKAGEEVLGSLWAVVREPLSDERLRMMAEAAGVIALTMLRAKVAADSATRLRVGLVTRLFEGGSRTRDAADQLGIASAEGIAVVALGIAGGSTLAEGSAELELQRTASAFGLHLRAIHPRAVAALLGRTVYAVVPVQSAGARSQVELVASIREFLGRLEPSTAIVVGVGPVAEAITQVPESRASADGVLRVLRQRSAVGSHAATADEVQVEWLLLRVRDALAAEHVEPGGPLLTLRTHDEERGTELVLTLRTWLDHFGDIRRASLALHVHMNTLRHRLMRIGQIAGIDLDDAETRFGLMLQLRLLK